MGNIISHRKTRGTRQWSRSGLNIQRGCEYNCAYCYARHNAVSRFRQVESARAWTEPVMNWDAVERRYGKRQGVVMFPTCHDITPRNLAACVHILKRLLQAGNRVLIVSKPATNCVRRMIEELTEWRRQIMFRFTITTLSNAVHDDWEQNAPRPQERMDCAALAMAAGYRVSISCEPFLGGRAPDVCDPEDTARLHYAEVARFSNGPIWFGLMNQISQRVLSSVPGGEVARIKAMREPKVVRWIYDALVGMKRIKFKESITNVLGLPCDVDEWPALPE